MIADTIVSQGNWFFRWRSYVLLVFIPLGLLTVSQPEPIETYFGDLADSLFEGMCLALAFAGLALRAFTIGFVPEKTSGRNTTMQVAQTLNTTGMYSLTRNPLYLGNAIIYVAIAMFTQGFYFTVLMVLFLIVYLERIIAAEERFLKDRFGAEYAAWAARVPAFFPRLTGWIRPSLPFSFRNVLRREYSGLFAVILSLSAIEFFRDFIVEREVEIDQGWLAALTLGALAYVSLRWLKKNTKLLKVPGR